jgi:small subunit ribosomal protein S17
MAEEEKTESTEQEEPQAEEGSAEGSDAQAAGPVAEDGPPADPPEDASSTPPAEEAEPTAETPPAEEAEPEPAAEAPQAEEAESEAAEPDPLDELPWKERARLLRSREPSEPRPAQSPEERAGARRERRAARAAARRRYRSGRGARAGGGTGTPAAERRPNAPKVRQGIVVSDKGDKTITVRIDITRRHRTYEKIVRQSRTLHAHDERNEAGAGDIVRVVETRPLSKTKRWRLVDVVEKAR